MRNPLIAGNWKMYKTTEEAVSFAKEFAELYKADETDVRTAICAPFTQLSALKTAFAGTGIMLGAQNVHFADEGAYTGEISVRQLEEIGVDFCIVGHSERRQYFAETNETVNKKLHKLFETDITPITQASFLELFEGDWSKVQALDQMIAQKMGFAAAVPVSGQTYSRIWPFRKKILKLN